nr:LytTR family DNA-binding domain-containing protein [Ochrobactrum sp. Marseille-Q0166]
MQHTAITAICYWVFYHKQFVCIFKLTKPTSGEAGYDERISSALFDRVVIARALGNYVGLTLSNGTQMEIRQRFSEVIKQLRGRGGIQVHRSYWVKGEEMISLKKTEHRFVAITRFGEVPISKNYLERVSVLCGARNN